MTGSPEGSAGAADGTNDSELFDFVALFLADRADGRVEALATYQRRFPGHEPAIAAEYARLMAQPTTEPPPLRRLGNYEVLGKLGSGGQGVVLLAEDTRLHRRVALKILAPHLAFVAAERLQRFRREAELLSQLDHPGICQVYEADTCDGVPFLAMRLVDGRTLATLLRERREHGALPRTRVELHGVIRWIESAARAVHEAHEHGVLHRDIKPGNLMITSQGDPVLLDFGLARTETTAADHAITRTGEVVGTLGYVAPELLGRRAGDRRADVYALGVTLYECLTHALPFAGDTPTALWRAIEAGAVLPPRQHNAAIPPELAAVVMTAIARLPAHRYATAAELADDLARVRRREPIRARPIPATVRALRWVQRHPTWSLGLAAAAVLIVALATSLDRVSANERAASALNRAIQSSSTEEGALAALRDLVAAAERSPRADLRNAMLQVLDSCHLSWQTPRTPVPANEVDPAPAVDPGGRLVALADALGGLTLRATDSGRVVGSCTVDGGPLTDVVFAGDHQLVAVSAAAVHWWRVPGLEPIEHRSLPPSSGGAHTPRPGSALALAGDRLAIASAGSLQLVDTGDRHDVGSVPLVPAIAIRRALFAPGGDRLAVLGKAGGADPHGCDHCWLIDTSHGVVTRCLRSGDQDLLWIEWHPTLPVLALGYNGGRVEVRAADTGEPLFARETGQEINWCGFDATGDLLLVPADRGTELWRWSATPPAIAGRLQHSSERTIGAAAFDRERGLFAAVLRDGLVQIWSTADWRPVRQFKHRVRDARFLAWLPTTGALLTADLDRLSAWFAGVCPHAPDLRGHRAAVTAVAMHPDGQRVLTGSRDGTVRLWSLDRAAPLAVLDQDGAGVRTVAFAGDGRRFAAVADDHVVRVFDTATGNRLATLRGHDAEVTGAWFRGAGVGDQLVTAGDDGRAVVWDVVAGTPLRQLRAEGAPIRSAALHPARPWLAAGGADRCVVVWDLDTGAQLRRITCSDATDDWHVNPLHQVRGLAFDPRADRLCASLVNNVLVWWDIGDGWREHRIVADRFGGPLACEPTTGEVLCADFSFGRLSLLRGDRIVPLLRDGVEAHANRISAIRLARDGTALSAGHDGQLQVWDLGSGTAVQTVHLAGAILDAAFGPDSQWIATADADAAVRLWPRDAVATARRYLAHRDDAR